MRVRILSIVDDISYETQEGGSEDGAVYVPARQKFGDTLIELVDYSRHAVCKKKSDFTKVKRELKLTFDAG